MTSLDQLPPQLSGEQAPRGVISALRLAAREAAWLRAIGLGEGVTVTVLRKAPLGGPLHVRVSGGAELAVDRELARHVDVEVEKA
ncbi:MAG: FeoA family protein [Archangium sp.]|nr:FeoA family protein [Archangium sp.]